MAITGCQLQNVTAAADQRVPRPWERPSEESQTLLTAEPRDLDYKREIIRRYTRNVTRPRRPGEMQ
jgi:hypothetical protein